MYAHNAEQKKHFFVSFRAFSVIKRLVVQFELIKSKVNAVKTVAVVATKL